jgi:hypothetical protein
MPRRAVVLVAASPPGLAVVRELLCDDFELVAVHSLRDAIERLVQGGIDLILAGLQFDESIVPALLEAVRSEPSTRAIPFVCCRFLPTVLRDASLGAARQVCEALGAEFIDFFELERDQGRAAAAEHLRSVVLKSLDKPGVNAR